MARRYDTRGSEDEPVKVSGRDRSRPAPNLMVSVREAMLYMAYQSTSRYSDPETEVGLLSIHASEHKEQQANRYACSSYRTGF